MTGKATVKRGQRGELRDSTTAEDLEAKRVVAITDATKIEPKRAGPFGRLRINKPGP